MIPEFKAIRAGVCSFQCVAHSTFMGNFSLNKIELTALPVDLNHLNT
jgi:hypothetical protein